MKGRYFIRSCLAFSLLSVLSSGVSHALEVGRSIGADSRTHSNLLSTPESRVYLDAMLAVIEEQIASVTGLAKQPTLVKDINAEAGFTQLCIGQGPSTVDGMMSSRRMTAVEFDACKRSVGDGILEIKLGHNALALVVAADAPAMDLTRKSLRSALTDSRALTWKEIDSSLPDAKIKMNLSKASVEARALLQNTVVEWGCQHSEKPMVAGCSAMRTDGVVDFSQDESTSTSGSVDVLSYSEWLTSDKENRRLLSVEGIAPNKQTVGSGLYPLGHSYYLYLKIANARQVDETSLLLVESVSAKAVMPEGYLVGKGLIPLDSEEHARLRKTTWRFDPMSSP